MTSSDDYRGRLKDLQAVEDKKDDLIHELLVRLDDLKAQRDEAKSDLEMEREARRRLQRSLKDTHPNRQRFAILILHLDAEVFLFDDQWMRRDPASGGDKMASEIVDQVKQYIKKDGLIEDSSGVQVIVKIYGDLYKLWRTYESAGSNLGSSDLTRFFSHLNRKAPLVDFVDFGPRKGSIEKKLSGVLQHHLLDDRVEHILFACPHNSIPPILLPLDAQLSTPLDTSSDHRARLTLLTVPPSPNAWDDLGLRTTSCFKGLFTVPPIPSATPAIPPRSSSHTPVRSHSARLRPVRPHNKSPPPVAPVPPPAVGANMAPRLRIRKEEGQWIRDGRDERSPPRVGFVGLGRERGGAAFAPLQVARRETYPNTRFSGVPPEAPSIPGLHWQ